MADQDFPVPELWPYVQPVWPKADATGMRAAYERYKAAWAKGKEGAALVGSGYGQLGGGYWADPSKPASDTYDAVIERRDGFNKDISDFESIAEANDQVMSAAPDNTDHAKDQISALAHVAAAQIQQNQLLSTSIYGSGALLPVMNQQVFDQLASGAKQKQQDYAGKNQALPQVPQYEIRNKVDYSQGIGGSDSGVNYQQGTGGPARTNLQQATAGPQRGETQQGTGGPARTNLQQATAGPQRAETQQGTSGIAPASSTSNLPTGSSQSQGLASGKSGSVGVPAGGASTGLQSAAGALAEHAAPAAAPQAAPASSGGGVGASPSIGGLGGGPAGGGAGQAPRIGGIGGGSGGEAPRTGAQGAGAVEKSSGSSSSSGSGESRGSGLSRGGSAGAGAVGGETRTQSASAVGVREAMRGDMAAGAGAHADRAAANAQVLGTGVVSGLHGPSLSALTTRTQAAASAWEALPDRLSARSPVLGEQDAQVLVGGGTLSGAARKGLDEKTYVFRRLPLPDLAYSGASFLLLVSEDYSVAPNPDVGVFRPVASEVTSTEANGLLRPGFEVPDGVRVLDRSAASVASDAEADAGKLALYLVKWRLESYEAHATSWRPVAVGFLADPGETAVLGLAQLGVEAYWPGRGGYTLESADAEDALVSGVDRVGAAGSRAEREEQAAFDARGEKFGVPAGARPDEPFGGEGLKGKDLASYEHYRRELGRSPTAKEYVEDRLARRRNADGTVDESLSF